MQCQSVLQPQSRRPRLLHLGVLALAAGEEPNVRRRIFKLVEQHPGLHQRDLARRLDLRPSHAEYHLHQLVKTGLLRTETSGRYKRYFVAVEPFKTDPGDAVSPTDRPWLALLREARPLELVAHLIQQEPLQLGEVSRLMNLSGGTVSYHVAKLEKQGIVERFRVGKQRYVKLQDRERLVRVLLEHEPPDDLVEGFEDLWEDIGL